ncbi:MAG: DUF945 family protein [Gammaproteobacteria bacterium]|nr:DUF945 family protein [Gammaproteobacteria bacterium]
MKQNIVLAGKVWQDGGYPLFFTGGKMRRPIQITLALLILAGLYTLLPFFFGIAAERYAYNFLNHENATLGNVIGFHLDFEQYNRGWFKSTAILQVEQKTNDGNYEIIKSIPVVIKHGPTYRRNDYFRAGLGMIESQNFRINDQLPYVAHFRESIGFAGEHGAFVLVSKNPDDAVADNFRFDSLALHMQSNLKANQFKFLITGNGLHYQDAQQSFSINIQKIQSTLQADYLSEQNVA